MPNNIYAWLMGWGIICVILVLLLTRRAYLHERARRKAEIQFANWIKQNFTGDSRK